jgi:predicted TIM-barrel fold metal-dependent hydrolase
MPKDTIVIDADRHIMEPATLWSRYLEPRFRERVVISDRTWLFADEIDGQPVTLEGPHADAPPFFTDEHYMAELRDAVENEFDASSNLRAMDREGVDVAIHFPTAGLVMTWRDGFDPELSCAMCRAYNNWLADFCATDRARMRGIAILPVQDIAGAVQELRRVKSELDLVGAFLRPNPLDGRALSDPYYFPLYEAASELAMPILIHEGSATTLPRLGRGRCSSFGLHIVEHPFEQMVACLAFCGDGVLERFPELKVGFMESGCGWVPFWLERMDEHWEHYELGRNRVTTLPPSEYFKRQCFVSCEGEERLIGSFLELVGDDLLVTATDYPHPDVVGKFPERTMGDLLNRADLSDEVKHKIVFNNPVRLYGLDASSFEKGSVDRSDLHGAATS